MADKQKTIEIIFGGVDKTGSAFKSVGGNLSSLERSVGNISGPVADISGSILKLQASITALGAAALAFAAKQAVGFESALVDLQKVMGDGEGAALDYADVFTDLSNRFGVDASAIVQSTADFRQAGFDIGDSLTLVEQSLLAVNAADLTTQQSSELLIGTLAGFKAPASEAANLLDVLNAVSNNAGASVEQLGEGFKILSPVAKTLGLTFEETAALLTPVVEVTRSGSESANALRTAISNLIKPTKERKELLEEELGIQLEIDGQRRDTKDVLYDLIDATQSLDDNEKQRVATIVAGAEQMSRFLAVLNGAERSEQILRVALEASGSTLKEFEVRTQSAEFALKQLGAAFTTAAKVTGLEYIDQTKAATQATTNLVQSFQTALQGNNADQLFDVIRAGLERFADRVNVIAGNLPEAFEGLDFSKLLSAFDGLGDEFGEAFGAIFGAVDLSTAEGLEKALQKIVDAFTALTNISAGILDGLEPLFDLIGEGVENFDKLDEETSNTIGRFAGLLSTINTLLPVLGFLGTALAGIGTTMLTISGAKGIAGLTKSLGGLSVLAAGAGKSGLIGAALFGSGAAGYGVGTVINEGISKIIQAFTDSESLGDLAYEWANGDEANEALGKMEFSLKNAGEAAKEFAEGQNDAADATEKVAEFVELDIEALNDDIKAKLDAKQAQSEFTEEIEASADAQEKSAGTLSIVSDETKKFAKETEKAAKQSEQFKTKLLEIASDERIAQIEANVELNIAQLEADTKQAVAIIENLGTSIQSTGDLLGSLFGNLENATGSKRYDIERQIALENKYREEAFSLQKEATQAQIELLRQKAQQIARGETIIKVNAEGLTPALELVFNEILEFAQVRANEQGLQFLTGI
jgi:TP901 family phage tail tape measure protein